MIRWLIITIAGLLVFWTLIEGKQWRTVVGLTMAFIGASYLFVRELQPVFVGWGHTLRHPDGSFSPINPSRVPEVARFLIRVLARLGPADIATMESGTPKEVWLKAVGFGAIAVSTFVQIIAAWP